MSTSLEEAYIIVLEDDPNAQLVILDLLRLGGANHCYSRKSVESAVTFAEKLPRVDLFLVDINIPGKSGYELLEIVRCHDYLNKAKIVVVTAGTLAEDVEKARHFGFDGFISKPLKTGEFARQIENILNGITIWDWR